MAASAEPFAYVLISAGESDSFSVWELVSLLSAQCYGRGDIINIMMLYVFFFPNTPLNVDHMMMT